LLGAFFDTGFTNQPDSKVAPRGDAPWQYRLEYYVHEFEFMQNAQIAIEDTNYSSRTRACNNLQFDYINTMTDNGEVLVSTVVDIGGND
jgi:hypothetical protein